MAVPANKLYRRDLLLEAHASHFRKELFAEDQLFNTEYLRLCAPPFPSRTSATFLQSRQSVSHSRVTHRRHPSLAAAGDVSYRDLYTEHWHLPPKRGAAILRSPFGEHEFTLPPLELAAGALLQAVTL